MDPFESLPAEIQVQILHHSNSRTDMMLLSHASPALFRARPLVLSDIVGKAMHGLCNSDMLQDAIAISMFPVNSQDQSDWRLVDHHLRRWGAKQLPDPVQANDFFIADKLASLSIAIHAHTDDFIQKATSGDLRRAYICLPEWSHVSLKTNNPYLPSKSEPPGSHKLNIVALSGPEKERIFRCFLRYELLCKIFRFLTKDGGPFDLRSPASASAAFWGILDRYERKVSAPWELEGIKCVFEYTRTLYGAISARFPGRPLWRPNSSDNSWLWEMDVLIDEEAPPSSAIINSWFQASFFISSFHYWDGNWYNSSIGTRTFIDQLALGGVDQIEHLLASDADYCQRFFDYMAGKAAICGMVGDLRKLGPPRRSSGRDGPGVWNKFYSEELPDMGLYMRKNDVLLSIYRQRAWALFDNERLYPDNCCFPTVADIKRDRYRVARLGYDSD